MLVLWEAIMRVFQRCLERLQKQDLTHMETYFNIPSEKMEDSLLRKIHLSIQPSEDSACVLCEFHYEQISVLEKDGWSFPSIPLDIERLMYSYFKNTQTISFTVDCSRDFPLRAPRILLHSTNSPDLRKAFETIQCKLYSDDWSPAMGPEFSLLPILCEFLEAVKYV